MAVQIQPPQSNEQASSSTPPAPTVPSAPSAAAVFKRLHPESYLQRYLVKDFRPDGRRVGAWRDVSVNVGSISTANGSALVRMGDTTVVCGIKAEIAVPDSERPTWGYVVPNVDLPALSSPRFKPGPPGDEAQVYSNWLNDLIVSAQTIPPSSLCISPGKAVYALYIDVVCINYDGNVFDAAVLAVMTALKNTRLPRATYDPISEKTTCTRGETFPLQLGRIPLSCSFGVFQSKYLLPDPTSFETPLLPTTLTIALAPESGFEGRAGQGQGRGQGQRGQVGEEEKHEAVMVRQLGLGGVVGVSAEDVLGRAWGMARERVDELRSVMDESLESGEGSECAEEEGEEEEE